MQDRRQRRLDVALLIGVVDAQHELPAVPPREQPVEQRRAHAADVQVAGRTGRETRARTVVRSLSEILSPGCGASGPSSKVDDAVRAIAAAAREDHPLGQAELHLPRLQVGDHDHALADEHRRDRDSRRAARRRSGAARPSPRSTISRISFSRLGDQRRPRARGRRADRPRSNSSMRDLGGRRRRSAAAFAARGLARLRRLRRRPACLRRCAFASIFAQLSLSVTVRFQTSLPARCRVDAEVAEPLELHARRPAGRRRQVRLQHAPPRAARASPGSARRGSSCPRSCPGSRRRTGDRRGAPRPAPRAPPTPSAACRAPCARRARCRPTTPDPTCSAARRPRRCASLITSVHLTRQA